MLALSKRNVNVTMVMEFLNHLVRVFKDYFGVFDEERIRYYFHSRITRSDNFVIMYELFDEMMDFGFPQACPPLPPHL